LATLRPDLRVRETPAPRSRGYRKWATFAMAVSTAMLIKLFMVG